MESKQKEDTQEKTQETIRQNQSKQEQWHGEEKKEQKVRKKCILLKKLEKKHKKNFA